MERNLRNITVDNSAIRNEAIAAGVPEWELPPATIYHVNFLGTQIEDLVSVLLFGANNAHVSGGAVLDSETFAGALDGFNAILDTLADAVAISDSGSLKGILEVVREEWSRIDEEVADRVTESMRARLFETPALAAQDIPTMVANPE